MKTNRFLTEDERALTRERRMADALSLFIDATEHFIRWHSNSLVSEAQIAYFRRCLYTGKAVLGNGVS